MLNDVAGIRVIASFIYDVYKIAHMLVKQDDIVLIQAKDYIKNPKPNGYRSHLKYKKYFKDAKGIEDELKSSADTIAETDLRIMNLRNKIEQS